MPSPMPFEGQRVRVLLELVAENVRLSAEEQASCWSAWIARGPDGPIVRKALTQPARLGRSSRTRGLED
jgi:hypothetical protein